VKYYLSVRTIFDMVKTGDADDVLLEASATAQRN